MEAQREQEERNRMFFRQIMEKQREAEAEEREKDTKIFARARQILFRK